MRFAVAGGPRRRLGQPRPLPDAVLEQLLTARDQAGQSVAVTTDEIRQELEFSGQIPYSFRREQCLEPVDRLGGGVPSRVIKSEVTEHADAPTSAGRARPCLP